MKLFRRSVELVVIRDYINPQNGIEFYKGHDIEQLLKQSFGAQGLSPSVKLYHGDITHDVTPKTPADVDKLMQLNGRIYAVVKPMGLTPLDWVIIGISALVSVATAFLMPVPTVGQQGVQQSPNNALAGRSNQQRLGGRVPDIFGTVWSVPDLIAQTYSVYVDSREIEFSYMCVGRGDYHVSSALDDITPIKYIAGSSVLIYNSGKTLNDEPDFVFGEQFNPSEAEFTRYVTKRYTSVNGQDLPYPDDYDVLPIVFRAPNIIETSDELSLTRRYSVGDTITIEGAESLESGNELTELDDDGVTEMPVTYNLSGSYQILSISSSSMTVSTDFNDLIANDDYTVEESITISENTETLWQGYYYTDGKDHDKAYVNLVALNGIYAKNSEGKPYPRKINFAIESEIVDSNGNAIAGTLVTQSAFIQSPSEYAGADGSEENITRTAATTIEIENPHYTVGKQLRFRISRSTSRLSKKNGQVVQDVKLKDFYSYRMMTANDYPSGVTTVYSKTRATEGALSLKERKLRLLVQRYVTDATSGLPKLSNRADDILRHVATDAKIGNMQLSQVDIAQIKNEIDAQIAYFGTDKCAEFCHTFDDNNISAEETIQTIAQAVFSQAKRQGNKLMLDFEREVPASVAIFNSHNILPDTFTMSQSLGIANDYDGVKVEYTDPSDDAVVTKSYPSDSLVNPHEQKLTGVRNELQAYMHMMRLYNKDRHAYKSCEFVAGDESNIVVRTNCITVADQLRANVQQGSVDAIETIGSDVVLHTTDPVSIEPSVAHTLFIQTINNGVESIAVTARDDYSVVLARLPSGEISTGYDSVVQAVYQIVSETDAVRDAYLVSQKDPSDGMTNKLLCTNYDDRYYQNDKDYINELII